MRVEWRCEYLKRSRRRPRRPPVVMTEENHEDDTCRDSRLGVCDAMMRLALHAPVCRPYVLRFQGVIATLRRVCRMVSSIRGFVEAWC